MFFIGDGQGTSGTQSFFVPTTATQLFLGFADGSPLFGSAATAAAPGGYSDNIGQLTATFDITPVPEPSTVLLIGLGLSGLGLLRKRLSL